MYHKFISIHSAMLYVDETQSGDQGRDLLPVPLRHSVDVCGRASWLADWVVGPSFKKRDPEVMIQLSGYHSPQSPWDGLHPEDLCCCHSGCRTVDRLLLYRGYWRLDGNQSEWFLLSSRRVKNRFFHLNKDVTSFLSYLSEGITPCFQMKQHNYVPLLLGNI